MSRTRRASKRRSPDATATRATILAAGRRLFAEAGFHGTSMSRIATEARVPQSLISHYFGSKAGLWGNVKEWYSEDFRRRGLEGGARGDSSADWVTRLFHLFREHPDAVRFLAWTQLDVDGEIPESVAAELRATEEMIRSAQQSGAIRRDIDPAHLRIMMFSLALGWYQWCSQLGVASVVPDDVEADAAYLRDLLRLLSAGLSDAAGSQGGWQR